MFSGNVRSDRCERNDVLGERDDHRRKWNALDPRDRFPFEDDDAILDQEADQDSEIEQVSKEVIVIKNSLDVRVHSTDTQVAVSIQAALQFAIAAVLRASLFSSEDADAITQELLQASEIQQVNKQSVFIDNSRNVEVRTTDTDVALNIQLLAQVLAALIATLDIASS